MTEPRKPRVGFLGAGWIGRYRMAAMLAAGGIEAVGVVEPSPEAAAEALALAPAARQVAALTELLALNLDGLVIATPSALHAEQATRALNAGVAVFCQKPLGRTEREVRDVVEAARRADRLLAVDLSYRHAAAFSAVRDRVRSGELGEIFAADLTFHNAYGPDKPWFYDPKLSGGGCVMDLGVHLVDQLLWALDWPDVASVTARLMADGAPLTRRRDGVEDYAVATLTLSGGAVIRLACSWKLNAGREAEIAATFWGTRGGAEARNVGGSFYDFEAASLSGVTRQIIASPPDDWGGRAAADWARRLAAGDPYDPEAKRLTAVHNVLDRIYACA